MAHLVGHGPAKQEVASWIPGQRTRLGCEFGPGSWRVQEATDRCFSPSLPPFLPRSVKGEKEGRKKGRNKEERGRKEGRAPRSFYPSS